MISICSPLYIVFQSISIRLPHGACLLMLSSVKVEGFHKYRPTYWNNSLPLLNMYAKK